MRKVISIILCLVLLMGMVVFAHAEQSFTPGTYTGIGYGHNGRMEVEVTFSEDAITDINIVSHNETAGIGEVAIEQLPGIIIDNQSLGVDAISSATDASHGILQAVEDAVTQAGGDVEALKAVEVKKVDNSASFTTMDADICVIGGGVSGMPFRTAIINPAHRNNCCAVNDVCPPLKKKFKNSVKTRR